MTDTAKELLSLAEKALREIYDMTTDLRLVNRLAEIEKCAEETLNKITALRLSARQQASVEELARSLCKADGTAQCAAICLSHFSTSTTGGKCPEAALVWGTNAAPFSPNTTSFRKWRGESDGTQILATVNADKGRSVAD